MAAPDPIFAFLERLSRALVERRVRLTWKADDEIAELGWSRQDAFDQLGILTEDDLLRTELPRSPNFSIIWVFCPPIPEFDGDRFLWIRLAEQPDHVFLVSFHIAEVDPWI